MSACIEHVFWFVLFFIEYNAAYLLMLFFFIPPDLTLKTIIARMTDANLNMCHFSFFFFSFWFEIRYFLEWHDIKNPNIKHTWT